MDNLILSFNVVLPLLISIILGYFLRQIKMLDDPVVNSLNKLCFKVFLPVYLFHSIYTTNISASFNGRLALFGIAGVLAFFALLMIVVPFLEKENPRRGVMIQAMFRSNFALFGLPVAISICGEQDIGPTSLMIGIIVPIYNILAVVTLETFRGGRPNPRKITRGILTNPLIIASVLGVLLNLLKFPLPDAILSSANSIGRVATPLALVALGGRFQFSSIRSFRRQLAISVVGKLIISPVIMVLLGIALGFRNEMLIPILIMFAAPTAVSSFPMAQQMDGDSDLAAALVVFTTIFSIVTIFLWVFVLKQLGVR